MNMCYPAPAWNNNSAPGGIFMKFDIWIFLENL